MAAVVLAVTACGGSPAAGPAPARGSGELRIVTGTDLTSSGVRRDLITDAEEKLGLDVTVIELPADADRQRSQLVAALQSGNKDGYDIVNLDVTWTAEFAAQGLIEPLEGDLAGLDPREDEGIWESVRRTVEYDGKAWAVPWNTDVGLLYYRADLLDNDPELATWDELIDTVGEFEQGQDGLSAGLVTQLASYEGLTVNTHEAVWRAGGEIVDEDGDVRVAEEKAADGLNELSNAFLGNTGGLPLLTDMSLRSTETEAIEHFLAGDALTMRNWPFARFRLQEGLEKSDRATQQQKYGVTVLPSGQDGKASHGVLGGQNLAIAAGSPDSEGARELIEEITDKAAGCKLYGSGFVPARKDALPRKDVIQGACDGKGSSLPEEVPREDSLAEQTAEALRRSMRYARPRPVTPYYGAVTRDIQDVMTTRLDMAPTVPDSGDHAEPEDLRDRLEESLRGK